MRVLVAVGSKHGATKEIAAAIAEVLGEEALQTTLASTDDSERPGDYDAAIVGSAVYAGRWIDSAREFVIKHRPALSAMPVWLFSSGPIGDPPKPEELPIDAVELSEMTNIVEHRLFAGKIDKQALGFGEKAVVLALRAPEGDFRDWDEIRSWARHIAQTLAAGVS